MSFARIAFASLATLLLVNFSAFSQKTADKSESPYFEVVGDTTGTAKMPLLSTSADVSIAGVIADVTVRQTYHNDGDIPLEAIYVFPASTRAAVYAMTMKIADRVLVAKIKEKLEARQTYEQAKREGKSASLLEQQKPNVFQMNVANIMPGDTIIVELRYTEALVPTDGVYEFVYPAVVGPRYRSPERDDAPEPFEVEAAFNNEGEKPSYSFDINLNLLSGVPIDEISSPSHKIKTKKDAEGGRRAEIALDSDGEFVGDKDFVLRYRLAGGKIETGLLYNEGEEENFFLLMLQPPKVIERKDITKREYVFVFDVSGSMNGFPLEVSKELMRNLLVTMEPDERFNIVFFAGSSALLSDTSLYATNENIENAYDKCLEQKGFGGTEIMPALERVISMPDYEGYAKTIIIITDGYISVEEKCFDLIRNNLNKANVFAFGIGSSVNRFLVEGLARAGSGEPFVVTTKLEAEPIAEKFENYVKSPIMTDIEIDYGGFLTSEVEPPSIPDVFADRPIIVFGKWEEPFGGTLRVSGVAGGQKLMVEIPVNKFAVRDTSQALKYLWARKRLETISDYAGYSRGTNYKDEIVDIGLKYNLLTKHTSFVAVDLLSRNPDSTSATVVQETPLPEGVSGYALGAAGGSMRTAKSYSNLNAGVPSLEFSLAPIMTSNNAPTAEEDEISEVADAAEVELKKPGKEPEPDEFIAVEKQPELLDRAKFAESIEYPDEARRKKIEGSVIVRALVDKNGKVKKTFISKSPDRIFNETAEEAVKNAEFSPAIQNGAPIVCWVTIPVKFSIPSYSKGYFLGKKRKFVETESGLKYEEMSIGGGPLVSPGSTVSISYTAYNENEEVIGYPNQTMTFEVSGGSTNHRGGRKVLAGLDEGVIGMSERGKRLIAIPPKLQVGTLPNLSPPDGEDLIIEVYVMSVK